MKPTKGYGGEKEGGEKLVNMKGGSATQMPLRAGSRKRKHGKAKRRVMGKGK